MPTPRARPDFAFREPPAALDRIIHKALEKDLRLRYRSASEISADLVDLQAAIGTAGPRGTVDASIVVLPFENLSPDPENSFFADGMTEELIAELAAVRALRVISRTTAMQFKGAKKSVPAIAGELNVRYVLEGSVRRAGSSVRITAQLIEAATDTHLWAERYTGVLDDVFDLQERLARSIVNALRVALTPDEERRLAKRQIQDARAFDLYLRARQAMHELTQTGLERASALLSELTRADKEFSWWLADLHACMGDHEAALRWLEQSVQLGFYNQRFWSEVDPFLAPLRGHPRFEELMHLALARQDELRLALDDAAQSRSCGREGTAPRSSPAGFGFSHSWPNCGDPLP